MNPWCGASVPLYAVRKHSASSAFGFCAVDTSDAVGIVGFCVRSCRKACAVKSNPRTSHKRPSVAVCFPVDSSYLQRDCRVVDCVGLARYAVRIFLILPVMSVFTGVKATLPRRSKREVVDSAADRNLSVSIPPSETGTSAKCVCRVSNQVWEGAMGFWAAMMSKVVELVGLWWMILQRVCGRVSVEQTVATSVYLRRRAEAGEGKEILKKGIQHMISMNRGVRLQEHLVGFVPRGSCQSVVRSGARGPQIGAAGRRHFEFPWKARPKKLEQEQERVA
jgi:hypothetical protein